jgi:hypothetical protein
MVGVAADAADHSTTVRDLLVVYPGRVATRPAASRRSP